MSQQPIQYAVDLIRTARNIVILTGAGVSKESGVPTFREAMHGLWAKYDPQQLATPYAFRANPQLVWDWYEWRRGLVREAQPNAGHIALAHLEHLHSGNVLTITQNVDDLHERAGTRSIIHLHGNIAQNKCFEACQGEPTQIDTIDLDDDGRPPHCPHCGGLVRPDVVWFGESLPVQAINQAIEASQFCDVMLVVGTSGLVNPAAQLPKLAAQNGATVIEINPDTTPITPIAKVKLNGTSGDLLPQMIAVLEA
ncbi:MAG: NAD-dependent deacylase [Anaerolineaceae bacterium]|nr:NAD-dependent deacylase [Anaerolineaceae bacterium]